MTEDKQPELVATISENLELDYDFPRLLTSILASNGKGTKVRVDIRKWYKKRTNPQNNYLFGVIYPTIIHYILEKTGQKFTKDDLHDRYKEKFLGYEVCELLPDLRKTKSSTDLNTKEFSDELVELICIEWADLGLYIPPPKKKEDR